MTAIVPIAVLSIATWVAAFATMFMRNLLLDAKRDLCSARRIADLNDREVRRLLVENKDLRALIEALRGEGPYR